MMHDVTFSVIIPWYNRQELSHTLKVNQSVFSKYPNAEVIVVNGGGDETQLDGIVAGYSNVTTCHLPLKEFNKSLCMNVGAHLARFPYLFFWDADMMLNKDTFTDMIAAVSEQHCFLTIDEVLESESDPDEFDDAGGLAQLLYYLEISTKDGRKALVETDLVRFDAEARTGPGLVFVSKEHFIRVNGMNSRLQGWGWEDLDLLVRLQLELGLQCKKLGSGTHLTHDDTKRFFKSNTKEENDKRNFMVCLSNYQAGRFSGSYSADIAQWEHLISSAAV